MCWGLLGNIPSLIKRKKFLWISLVPSFLFEHWFIGTWYLELEKDSFDCEKKQGKSLRSRTRALILLSYWIYWFWNHPTIDLFYFAFLGPHPQHMEVPWLGVKLELQLLAYSTATAMQDPSHIYNLHHSSGQWWISNPLSKARDWACILVDVTTEPQWELQDLF